MVIIKGVTMADTLVYFSYFTKLMLKVAQAYDSRMQGLGGFFSSCLDRTLNAFCLSTSGGQEWAA